MMTMMETISSGEEKTKIPPQCHEDHHRPPVRDSDDVMKQHLLAFRSRLDSGLLHLLGNLPIKGPQCEFPKS